MLKNIAIAVQLGLIMIGLAPLTKVDPTWVIVANTVLNTIALWLIWKS